MTTAQGRTGRDARRRHPRKRGDAEAHWRRLFEEWAGSGLSKATFCRQKGISQWGFYFWAKRLREQSRAGRVAFARVEASSGGSAMGIVIRLSAGLAIELDSGFDEESLRRLLRVVAGPC